MSNNVIELNKCDLSEVPEYLPKELKTRIQTIIDAFAYAETNPYYSYFVKTSEQKLHSSAYKQMTESTWSDYKKRLNRYNNTFNLILDDRMEDVWHTLYIDNKDSYNFFEFISNKYNNLVGYQTSTPLFPHMSNYLKEIEYFRSIDGLNEFKFHLEYIKLSLLQNFTLFSPDGADCFEGIDTSLPENKMYLDSHGNIPYKFNWDLYIKDEEMVCFQDILDKLIIKVENRINYDQSDRKKSQDYLNNPASRKKKVDGACEIQLAKMLYIRFMQELKQPCYKEISIILEVLFGSPYTYNDIVKFTKKPRDNINKLKEKIKKEGSNNYFNDNFDEESLMD